MPSTTSFIGGIKERTFSVINLNKTKVRNQLSAQTLTGVIYSKMLGKEGIFNISSEKYYEIIRKFMNSSMYV